jgi:hypothetical protein
LDFCPFGGIKVLGLKTNKKVKKNDKKGGGCTKFELHLCARVALQVRKRSS